MKIKNFIFENASFQGCPCLLRVLTWSKIGHAYLRDFRTAPYVKIFGTIKTKITITLYYSQSKRTAKKVSELERLNVKTVDYKLFRNLSVSDRHH